MERVKLKERDDILSMQKQMYEKSRLMQEIQNEIESISSKNSKLEQDFEHQVDRQNKQIKEAGQIINSIENIYRICEKLARDQNKKLPVSEEIIDMDRVEKGDRKMQEKYIKQIQQQLETSNQYVSDLVKINQEIRKQTNKMQAATETKKQKEGQVQAKGKEKAAPKAG